MKKRYLRRFTLAASLIMTGFFGFPGMAMADQASISGTGPDSYNKIEFENKNECDVENNNDVGVKNINFQNAHTGDAVVGSNWGAYAPEAWQVRGASYDEWRAAVNAYMADYEWGGHGGGNTVGGDAHSGNANNSNDTNTKVNIDNSGACGEVVMIDTNGDGKPDKKVVKKPGQVLGGTSSQPGHGGAGGSGGHVLGATSGPGAFGVGGQGGVGGAFSPTTSGGAGGPSGPGGHGAAGDNFSISNTGPDSFNKISVEEKNKVHVENNNNVNVVNVSKQSASSGDATVSGNTKAGGAGSGDASNGNGTNTGAGINN